MSKLSGGLNNWYVVPVKNPQRKEQEPYQAECEDIIQALGMTFDEGCAFKALWRNAASRMGNGKPGNTAVYDAEKLVHYANRILSKERIAAIVEPMGFHGNTINNDVRPSIKLTGGKSDEVCFHQPEDSNGVRPLSNQERDENWIYSALRPHITQPFKTIDVVYRGGIKCTYADTNDIAWPRVFKYRINCL